MMIKVVLTCDNTLGTVSTQCSYSHTIGTEYSTSLSKEMSISTGIEASMESNFMDILSAGLKVSHTTGYNWGQESSEAKSKQVTTTVQATAPAGMDDISCIVISYAQANFQQVHCS